MPAGAVRLAPFLTASMVMHVIVFVAAGPESLTISTAPADEGHEVSIRLEAAAPAGAAASSTRDSNGDPKEEPRSREPSPESEPDPPEVAQLEFTSEPTHEVADESTPDAFAEPEEQLADSPAASGKSETDNDRTKTTEPVEHPATDDVNPQPTEQVAEIDDTATGDASTSSRAQRAEARNAIVAELAKHFRYPRLAQRHGWEGTVVLSVRILPDGRLDDIRITRSSGRALLDRSARRALAGVERLPQFADRVGEVGLTLEIPVTYRLESA